MSIQYDVIIVGAGAAGMMSAIEAGKRGRKVLLVDHYKKIGEKIRISGGGRCNFTNINTNPNKFLSQNPKFVRSALSQYTQNDFINLINKYEIKFHEKKLGQLFCDHSAQQIVEMLLKECELANVNILKEFIIKNIEKDNDQYLVSTETDQYSSESLIVATGGLSVPKIGATSFGYEIAKKFNHSIIETLPALVPLTFNEKILEICKELTGLSVEAIVSFNKVLFQEGMLFTHRGLSGPSILQISSYWKQGDNIKVNLSPRLNVYQLLEEKRKLNPKFDILNIVSEILPKRLAQIICRENKVSGNISELSNKILKQLSENINSWLINPTGSEGYRTAEVTLGGVDTKELSSKTMMSNKHNNLFFIGEVVDVTGHLGGYNFQWALVFWLCSWSIRLNQQIDINSYFCYFLK
jgi:predicted Rossmann fold flavoprotein